MLPVFCRTHISATTRLIHANSSLIEAPPCVDVHYHMTSGVGQVMGYPWAVLRAPGVEVLSVLDVALARDHASLLLVAH